MTTLLTESWLVCCLRGRVRGTRLVFVGELLLLDAFAGPAPPLLQHRLGFGDARSITVEISFRRRHLNVKAAAVSINPVIHQRRPPAPPVNQIKRQTTWPNHQRSF